MQQNHGGLYRFNLFVGSPPAPYVNVGRVYYAGGFPQGTNTPSNDIEAYDIFSDSMAVMTANLSTARHGLFGLGGDNFGLLYGGRSDLANVYYDDNDKLTYSSEVRNSFVTLSGYKMAFGASMSGEAAGYAYGGAGLKTSDSSALDHTTLGQRFEWSSERTTVFLNFLANNSKFGAAGSSRVVGLITLGRKSAAAGVIGDTDRTALRFSFADNILFSTNGVLLEGHAQAAALSSNDFAYIIGGYKLVSPGSITNITSVEKSSFSNSSTQSLSDSISVARFAPAGGGNAQAGFVMGGQAGVAAYHESIEKVNYTDDVIAISSANLNSGMEAAAAISSKLSFYEEPGMLFVTATGYAMLSGQTIGIFGHRYWEQFGFTERTTRSGTPSFSAFSETCAASNATNGLSFGYAGNGNFSTIDKFSFASEAWEAIVAIPSGNHISQRAMAGNATEVVLGPGFNSFSSSRVTTVHKFTYASDTFSAGTACPDDKLDYAMSANVDVAAMFGGQTVGPVSSTSRYKFSDNTHIATSNLTAARDELTAGGNGVSALLQGGRAAGNIDQNTTERYSFAGGAIEVLNAFPYPRSTAASASNPNELNAFGGYNDPDGRVGWVTNYDFSNGVYDTIEQSLTQHYNRAAAFSSNPAFGSTSVQWGEVPDGVAQPVGYGGYALIAGGYSALSTTHKYSFSSDAQEAGTSLIGGRYGGGHAGNRDFGMFFSGTYTPPAASFQNYSLTTEKYTWASQAVAAASNMLTGRTFCESVGNSTEAITAGGDNSGGRTASAEEYIYASNARSNITALAVARRNITPFNSATVGYFANGENSSNSQLNSVEKYNFSSNARSNGTALSRQRQSGFGLSSPTFAIIAGDSDTGVSTVVTEKYTYASDVVMAATNLKAAVNAEVGAEASNPQIGLIRNGLSKVQKYAFNDDTTYETAGFADNKNSPMGVSSNPGHI